MNVAELKKEIENKKLSFDFLVLQWSDTSFLANQYLNEIIKIKNVPVKYIDDLSEIGRVNGLMMFYLEENKSIDFTVLKTSKLTLKESDLSKCKNLVIICEKIDDDTKQLLINNNYLVELPKLLTWNILDYGSMKCPGLTEKSLESLLNDIKDIYRFDNELNKISIFEKDEQRQILSLLCKEHNFQEFGNLAINDYVDAIEKKDINKALRVLENIEHIDIEGTGLVTKLLYKFKALALFKTTLNATPTKLKMSDKQFSFYRTVLDKVYNLNQVINIIEFLTTIDSSLKMGNLDMSNHRLVDYITCRVFALGDKLI